MISVIIPSYNAAGYIKSAIESVLKQSHEDFEIIVIDDASTDDTARIVKSYSGDARMAYKKIPRGGTSRAKNIGIDMSKGNLIAFLDSDDIFLPGKLEKQAEFLTKNSRYGLCYTDEVFFSDNSRGETGSANFHFSGDVFYYLKRSNFISLPTVMIRKNILGATPFDEGLKGHEDWDLFLRLAREGVRFGYLDEPLSKIRVRHTSATFDKSMMDATRREVGLRAKKYWKSFKSEMSIFSLKGWRAITRYLKFKIGAFLLGFPKKACFKRPVPQEIV